ncbi:MAG TPA: LPS assembly protein LptD, partial [Burkholderiales bacterium]
MQPHNARVRAAPGTGAALFAVLLWAGCAWAQDSSVQKGPTTIDAQSIEGISDVEVRARGSVELRRDETTVFSERLLYNQEFGRIDADGGVRLELGGDRFFGPRLRFDTTNNTGVFESPTYLLQRGQPARGSADRIEFLGKDLLKLTKSTFTTCAPGRPGWMLEMGELELDYEKNEGRVKDAKVRLLDTTILALPFGSFPLEKQRKSGFLTPSYSHTTLRGAEVRAPFYWNIAPEQDATITPVYMSKRGLQLKTQYRYLDPKYLGNLQFEIMPEDQQTGRSRSGFSLLHTHYFSSRLYGQLNLNKVSDDRYFVDLSSQVNQVSTGNLQQSAFLHHSAPIAGFGVNSSIRLQRFQTLQDPTAPIVGPYFALPQLNVTVSRQDIAGLADVGLPAEYVRFSHASLVEGSRVAFNPTVGVPLLTPGGFLRSNFGLRHVSYKLDRTAPGQTDSPSYSVPWMSLDGGLVFERPVRWFGQSLTQTFEPRLFYVRAPFKDQSRIPVFDTGLSEFNYAQIFTANRFSGGDRFGDANDLTAAVTSRVLGRDGQESFRATLGQRFYFDDERVALNATTPLR